MRLRPCSSLAAVLAAGLGAWWAVPAALGQQAGSAKSAGGASPLAALAPRDSIRQAEYERLLSDAVQPDSLRRWSRGLAARPHMAGTPAQAATRDSVVRWLRTFGLEIGYDSLILYMPRPRHVEVRLLRPTAAPLPLEEPPLPSGPPETDSVPGVPVFHAFSGSGVAEGDVVFANYGLPADYRVLDSLGVSVRGRIVVARYGRSFRGIKAREAEVRGAAGLLLYPDPEADGFVRGAVYPEGPMRPPRGVQRGSLLNASGDPSTPGVPSVPGAPRVPEEQMEGLSRIPVVPIGYGAASKLLEPLGGPEAPESWQGGLPFPYHAGPGPSAARVEVEMERGPEALHPAFNTIAALRGTTWPDEWVIIGAHRDAWGPGAVDNVSGSASVVEVARVFAQAARNGSPPRRTIVFATWDAEEWGIMGSIEWVEANAERLGASAVAYVNLDAVVSGWRFGAAAAPELKSILRQVAKAVEDPRTGRAVYDVWRERSAAAGGLPAVREEGSPPLPEPRVGDLGGGSDHKGFYQHLGIPALGFGFGGPGGVYHSMYDSSDWMERFGDEGYRYHAAVAKLAAVALARLSEAEVLPFDFPDEARQLAGRIHALVEELRQAVAATGGGEHGASDAAAEPEVGSGAAAVERGIQEMEDGLAEFRQAADRLAEARLRTRQADPIEPSQAAEINALLRRTSRAFASPEGLPGDGWSRQLLFASDPDNGYASLPLPAPRLALRAGDLEEAGHRAREVGEALRRAAGFLSEAAARLREVGGQ